MAISRSTKAFQFSVSDKLLHAWISPTILGCDRESLGLEDGDTVCYAFPYRSILDLLVTNKACELNGLPTAMAPIHELTEKQAFFFLGHSEGAWGRKTQRAQSSRMTRLFDHQAKRDEGITPVRPIKIIPVSLFWGHQPDREKSLLKLLLSENWSATSVIKKFLALLFHPRHILVQFGQPINLSLLMASTPEGPRQIRKLMRLLRTHFNHQKQAILGPDLSHRRTLLHTMLASPEVREAIAREARHKNVAPATAEKTALRYAREIASDQSYRIVRLFDILLTWLWNRLYDGIEVNGVAIAKDLAQSHEIIFTPCHRSHIDYLLLSYVLYHNGLTPPHIAAGKNLYLPVVGKLLRRAGAFFMRRSFKGDALYKVVFDEYLHQMFKKGYSVEYFIEGGRSRTGRTLTPRTGMLSMTVRSFQRDSTRPIAFLPVYFGYERVLESSSYMTELAGKDKKEESLFDIFKIFSFFKHPFGEVTVNFGEPLLLRGFLDEHLSGWTHPADVNPRAFSQCCVALSRKLATRINTAVAIKPTNLVALALLSTTRLSIEEGDLNNQVDLLAQIARRCGGKGLSVTSLQTSEVVEAAISIVGLNRHQHRFGRIISASPRNLLSLTYNANNVIHIYMLPSLVARYILTYRTVTPGDLTAFCRGLFPFLQAEMFLPGDAHGVESQTLTATECMIESGIISKQAGTLVAATSNSREYSRLQELSRISDPMLERYYIVITLLQKIHRPSSRQLEVAASSIAEHLSALYGNNSPDFFERSLFSTFLAMLKQQELVTSKDLTPGPGLDLLQETTAETLSPDIRYQILQTVNHYVSTEHSTEHVSTGQADTTQAKTGRTGIE